MTDPRTLSEDERTLAGELALRVLTPAEEAEARAKAEADRAFAAEVEAWEERLGGLTDEVTPVEASSALWPRILAALGGDAAANDNGRLAFWRGWAVGSTGLLAASLAAIVLLMGRPEPVAPVPTAPQGGLTRVATLTLDGQNQAAMTLVYDAGTGNLYLSPTEPMPDGRVPHLWLVMPEGGVQLVGAFDGSEASRHHLDRAMNTPVGHAAAVAISMEAPGHTPAANRPDGPVIASGELRTL